MNIIMPVVGMGKRFRESGYPALKPFIKIRGRKMIEWALDPIPESWHTWVICRKEEEMTFNANIPHRRRLDLIAVPGMSQGAALTVLAAAAFLPPDDPVAIINCDQWFKVDDHYSLIDLNERAIGAGWDGYILTFKGEGTRWSYVQENNQGWVSRVAEKQAISNEATVGFYWFRRASDLVRAVCDMVSSNQKVNNEFYLAPCYNELIWRYRRKVKSIAVSEFWGLGTPEDVETFQRDFQPTQAEGKTTERIISDGLTMGHK